MARGCKKVLIEERLEGSRLGTFDVFEIAAEESNKVRTMFKAIAYVDVNAEGTAMMQFAETVAVNRMAPVTVFQTVEDAEKWLLSRD